MSCQIVCCVAHQVSSQQVHDLLSWVVQRERERGTTQDPNNFWSVHTVPRKHYQTAKKTFKQAVRLPRSLQLCLMSSVCLLVLLHDILYMILCNVTRQRCHKEASSKASMWERRQRSKKTIKREIERLRMSYSIAIANMQLSKTSLGSICFLWSDKKAVWEKKSTDMTLICKQSRPAEPQLAAVVTQQALLQKIHGLHHHQLIFYQSTFQKVELTR